ncbi:SDR family oxidoreductase [Vibrio sp. WJH972]
MNNLKQRILVAGATGYLGSYIIRALQGSGAEFYALARHDHKLKTMGLSDKQITIAEVTNPVSLIGCCDDIDVVISCVGITKQKDGLGYQDVDYQANSNLLKEAQKSGVKKFIYISAFNAPNYQGVRLLKAKEMFASELLNAQAITPCVIRPNGFFSDLEEYYKMAQQGRAYVFGQGEVKLNPIHGSDLANFCLEAIDRNDTELDVGGPDILSINDIAELGFSTQQNPAKITCLPDWVRTASLLIARRLPERIGGPFEFFLTVCAQDMIAPTYGEKTLEQHFKYLYDSQSK